MGLKHTQKQDNVNRELFDQIFMMQDLNEFENVYLFSDINMEDKKLFNFFKREFKNKEKMIFIASDPENHEKIDKKVKEFKKYLKKIGLKDFEIIDNRMTKYAAINHIERADILFLVGGDPIKQFNFIKEYELDNIIKGFKGSLIGWSAGAMNLAKEVQVSIDKDNEDHISILKEHNLEIKSLSYEGLVLVDITIDPHFDKGNKNQVKELLKAQIDVIGLPDESYIKVDKYGIKTIYGTYYTRENNKLVEINDEIEDIS